MLLAKKTHKRLSIVGPLMDPREFSAGGRLETSTVVQEPVETLRVGWNLELCNSTPAGIDSKYGVCIGRKGK